MRARRSRSRFGCCTRRAPALSRLVVAAVGVNATGKDALDELVQVGCRACKANGS